jgi:hypothetical protein
MLFVPRPVNMNEEVIVEKKRNSSEGGWRREKISLARKSFFSATASENCGEW